MGRSLRETSLWRAVLAAALVGLAPGRALADGEAGAQAPLKDDTTTPARLTFTLKDALALASRSAPAVLSARALRPEAEAARVEANVFPRQNPTFEIAVGPKIAALEPTPAVSLELMQLVDLGGGVGARSAFVDADVARVEAEGDVASQAVLRAVGLAFVRALWAEQRVVTAGELLRIAEETLTTSELRRSGGEISQLEINVAKIAVARAKSAVRRAEADRAAPLGELHVLLGIPQSTQITLKGKLEELETIALPDLLKRAKDRPDLRALAAETRGAQADLDLGDALAAPALGFGLRYDHDSDADTILGVLSLSLPMFDHGQGLTAKAQATQRRTQADLEQRQAQIPIAVRAAYDLYQRRVAAVRELEGEIGGAFDDNLSLAKRGFDAGESSFSELLLLRREILESRLDYLDRLLEAREAAIVVRAEAGALP